jgi:hypothetical protein
MIFDIYSDPGHAWCKVHRSLIENLGIADKITHYSYQRGEYVYLEEDCDLTTFAVALRATGQTIQFREHHTDKQSKIRSYDYYRKPNDLPFKTGLEYMTY